MGMLQIMMSRKLYLAVRQVIGRYFSENIPGIASFALAVGSSADWLGHEASSINKHTKALPITCWTAQSVVAVSEHITKSTSS